MKSKEKWKKRTIFFKRNEKIPLIDFLAKKKTVGKNVKKIMKTQILR
jgi:hypothetical protein